MFTIADWLKYLNEVFLPSYDDREDADPGPATPAANLAVAGVEGGAARTFRVQMSTALAWAHKLGLKYKSRTKSYYVDGHDRLDVLLYRSEYLHREQEYELRMYLWTLAYAEVSRIR